MSQTHRLLVTRNRDPEGRTLFFTVPSLKRARSPVDFLRVEEVPDFEGDSAWFECERRNGKMRPIRIAG